MPARDRVCMQLLTACNMRCRFCDLPDRGQMLAPETTKNLISQFVALGVRYFDLTGGETLLYKGLADLVAHVKHRGAWCSVVTNGWLLTQERSQSLADAGMDALQLSIDGIGGTHDRLRGKPGAFDRVKQAIAVLAAFPRQRNIATTLTADNIEQLPQIEALAEQYQVGFWFTLAAAPTDDIAAELRLPSPQIVEQVSERMVRPRSREKLGWIIAALRNGRHAACKVPDIRYTVLADGTLAPCAFLPGCGNLSRQSVAAVDASDAFRDLRRRARRRDERVCEHCYIWVTR